MALRKVANLRVELMEATDTAYGDILR